MRRDFPRQLGPYALTLASSALVLIAALVLASIHESLAPLLLLAPVLLGAWYGGFGPGLLATIVGLVAIDYFFERPPYASADASGHAALSLLIYALAALLVVMLGSGMRAAHRRATAARAEAEAERRRSDALADVVQQLVWVSTAEGRMEVANRRWSEYLGYSPEAPLSRQWVEMIHPADLPAVRAARQQGLATGEAYGSEYRLRRADGGYRWHLSRVEPVKDAEGRVLQWFGTATDIDDVKRAHQEQAFLAELSKQLAGSLDYATTLARVARLAVPMLGDVCIIDLLRPDGTVERTGLAHVDPAREALLVEVQRRYPPTLDSEHPVSRVLRTGEAHIAPAIDERLLSRIAQNDEHLRAMRTLDYRSALVVPLAARQTVLGAMTVLTAGPDARQYTADDVPLAEEVAGRCALAVENARLYGELQVAEARYRALFDAIADAIVVTDDEGRYLEVNQTVTQLLGYTRDELVGRRVGGLAVDSERARADFARLLRDGMFRGEGLVRRKDGTTVEVESRVTAAALPSGRVFIGILRDISDRRASERLQQEFLAMVGHELKTPLTAVKGYAQLMQRRQAYSAAGVEAILSQAGQLERLIDDLRDASQVEAGRLRLRRATTDLGALARAAVQQVRLLGHAHSIRLEAPETPVEGQWDHGRLAQVCHNLLANAVKYSPQGGEIVVRVEALAGVARLTVRDEGIGIAPQAMPHLFERFYRAAEGDVKGLGLGLFISKALVEAHGGTIWAESDGEGRGSTFGFSVPYALPTDGDGVFDAAGVSESSAGVPTPIP